MSEHKPEHPGPWRWKGRWPDAVDADLVDATGAPLLDVDETMVTAVPVSPVVRELIRLAPEMEELVRDLNRTDEGCMCCGAFDEVPHEDDCKLGIVLAALDAARKGT